MGFLVAFEWDVWIGTEDELYFMAAWSIGEWKEEKHAIYIIKTVIAFENG